MNDADFLSRVSLFSLVNKPDLERIAKLANRHTFDKGDVIIKEGEPDNRLFIIVSGVVNRQEVDVLLSDGADDFMKKPFDIDRLIERMAELVNA